jgi:serine/threonine-protein kinase
VVEGAHDAAGFDAGELMRLSTRQMARLGELLDEALPLPAAERRAWLESLGAQDQPLVRSLREALLADDPEIASIRSLDRLPTLGEGMAQAEHRVGERLGAYQLLEPLGAGGMAEVWLARRADGAFERRVALKIPRLGRVPDEMAERFARECRILATLEYPRIARLYDAGVDDGIPYIAMEYVQGEPLVEWCQARALSRAARIELFLQVLDAVGHAHAQGIVHRDLKSSNILVNGNGEVRLLDFGVASLLQAPDGPPSLTRVYGRALTPEYASPELLRGEQVDARSDVYSLGVVMHELLTGSRPPQGVVDSSLGGALGEVLAVALAASPADRFAGVATFAAALRDSGSKPPMARRVRKAVGYGLAAAVVMAIALATNYWSRRPPDAPEGAGVAAAPTTATIAVLPFVDLSENHDRGYLSDGLAEELIDLLTKTPELRVTARASSFAMRDRDVGIPAIARELNVDNVLDGSVRTAGNRLKFTVQLVRAKDGTVIWSDSYDRELQDIFEIQEEVAAAVVEALKFRLLPGNALASERRTSNVEAYEQYLLGRQFRDDISVERQRQALAAFERAAALEPSFAPAHAGVALAAAQVGDMTMTNAPYDLALAEAERALALAPRLPEAYVARANVRMHRNWDFVGARTDLQLASEIEPNNMDLLQAHGTYLWMTGKVREALELQRRTVARNPLSSMAWDWLGVMSLDARDYPAARRAFERADQLSPYSDYRGLLKALLELHSGDRAGALRQARLISHPLLGDFARALTALAAGRIDEAHAARKRLVEQAPDMAAAQIGVIYAAEGNAEQAFHWFDRAIALRDPGLFSMQYHPEVDGLRHDPRYQRVLRLMNVGP